MSKHIHSGENELGAMNALKSTKHYSNYSLENNYDQENDKNQIVEESPKRRFLRFNEELGSGAYKTVYRAYDNDSGCEVAWNVIRLHRLPQSTNELTTKIHSNLFKEERKRIADEINLLKSLKHPNVIHFINAWINRQKDEVVFITEIVTGGSLKNYLKKIKSPRLKVIKGWCREILQGIEYLHSHDPPIIHRDIKCENIFINSNSGEIRIGDLGLSTCMTTSYADSVLGTPEFMAPEMYEESYGPSVDIYSFGMCLLEMATLQTPYKECLNAAQVYKKVISGKKPACLDLISNEDVKMFILECLRDKNERATVYELLRHKFLQVTDSEADNQPIKLYPTPTVPTEEENGVKINERKKQDVWTPVNRNQFLKEGVSLTFTNSQFDAIKKIDKPETPSQVTQEHQNLNEQNFIDDSEVKEEEFNYQYQLVLESTGDQGYYLLLTKYREGDSSFLQERLIQIERTKLNLETLIAAVQIKLGENKLDPSLLNTLRTFVADSYGSEINQKSKEERSKSRNDKSFQREVFFDFYQKYLNLINTNNIANETEKEMVLRQNNEILELQNIHRTQQQALAEKKSSLMLSTKGTAQTTKPIMSIGNTGLAVGGTAFGNPEDYQAVTESTQGSNKLTFANAKVGINADQKFQNGVLTGDSIQNNSEQLLNDFRSGTTSQKNTNQFDSNQHGSSQLEANLRRSPVANTSNHLNTNRTTKGNLERFNTAPSKLQDKAPMDIKVASDHHNLLATQEKNLLGDKKPHLKPPQNSELGNITIGTRDHFSSAIQQTSQKETFKVDSVILNTTLPKVEQYSQVHKGMNIQTSNLLTDQNGAVKQGENVQRDILSPTDINSKKGSEFVCPNGKKIPYASIENMKNYQIKGPLKRGEQVYDEDVKAVQLCLAIITDQIIEPIGHYGLYTEKIVKSYQERMNYQPVDGIIDESLWEKMKAHLQSKTTSKLEERQREKQEAVNKMLETKKIIKDKQSKEATETLSKITSELVDLSQL